MIPDLALPGPRALGATAGLLVAAGLWLTARWAASRRVSLDQRIAPYLRPVPQASRLLDRPASRPLAALDGVLAPLVRDAAVRAIRWLSPAADLPGRLDRAGRRTTPEEFRSQQLVWGAVGLAGGLVLALAIAGARPAAEGPPAVALVVLALLGAVLGVLARDHALSRAVARREARILVELPTVAELLALAVAAGEGPVAAVERVTRSASGELAAELRRTLADVHAGTPFTRALDALAARSGVGAVARFAAGIAVAVERGTPLADVLRAQAQDVRDAGRRALIEEGGRAEILMMVPVVFLVLPVTVLFAVFPGLAVLRLQV